MSDRTGIILGFDPGGRENFGWSICHASPDDLTLLRSGLSSDAQGAFATVTDTIRSLGVPGNPQVLAAGIDAPMFWSAAGDREADRALRSALPFGQKNLVMHVNSLQGACLVQGVLLGKALHERYGGGGFRITESHPSALFQVLKAQGRSPELEDIEVLLEGVEDNEQHQADATICAYAGWSMLQGSPGWQDLYCLEPRPVQPLGTPVSYWMPLE